MMGKRGADGLPSERAGPRMLSARARPLESGPAPVHHARGDGYGHGSVPTRDVPTATYAPPPTSGSRSRASPIEPGWDRRRDELESALALAGSDEERLEIHEAFAELHEFCLDEPGLAMEHYEAAIRCEPSNVDVLRGLERIYMRLEMFDGAVDVLRRRLDLHESGEERARILLRLGYLFENHYQDWTEAIPIYWEVVSLIGPDEAAFDALQRGYYALSAWPEYVETVNRRIDAGGEGPNAVTLLTELARVLEEVGDLPAALAALVRARAHEPDNGSVLAELVRVAAVRGDGLAAMKYRVQLAELGDDEHADDAGSLVHAHMTLAQMLERDGHPGHDLALARTHYERVVALDAENVVAWERLQRMALASGATQRAAFCLMERAKRAPSISAKADLFVELGQLWENRKKGASHARSAYELALETDPSNVEATASLVRIYSEACRKDPTSALSAERLLEAHASEGGHAAALFRIGTRVAMNVGRASEAIACAIHAFSLLPNDETAAVDLVDVCLALREQPAMLERAHGPLEMLTQRATRLPRDLVIGVGQVQLARGELVAAVECFVAALASDPADIDALASLSTIHGQREDWPALVVTERALADLTVDSEPRAARLRALAAILETRLGDGAQAADLYVEASHLSTPASTDLEALVRIFTTSGETARLAEMHRRFFLGGARADAARAVDGGDRADRATAEIESLRDRARLRPLDPAGYKALYAALRKRGASDAALAVAAALEHLGAAHGEPAVVLRAQRVRAIHELPGELSASCWYAHLIPREMDPALTTVLSIAAAVSQRTRPHGRTDALARAAGEQVFSRGARSNAASRVARDVRDAARVLGLPPAAIVERAGTGALITAATLPTPSILLAPAALPMTDARFVPAMVGASVAELHPLLAARVAFRSVSEVRLLLESAMRACPKDTDADVSRAHAALRFAMTRDEHEEITEALARLRARPGGASVDAWCLSAMVTSARAALVLTGNLDATYRALAPSFGSVAEEIRRELLSFAVSASYVTLRTRIGAM